MTAQGPSPVSRCRQRLRPAPHLRWQLFDQRPPPPSAIQLSQTSLCLHLLTPRPGQQPPLPLLDSTRPPCSKETTAGSWRASTTLPCQDRSPAPQEGAPRSQPHQPAAACTPPSRSLLWTPGAVRTYMRTPGPLYQTPKTPPKYPPKYHRYGRSLLDGAHPALGPCRTSTPPARTSLQDHHLAAWTLAQGQSRTRRGPCVRHHRRHTHVQPPQVGHGTSRYSSVSIMSSSHLQAAVAAVMF